MHEMSIAAQDNLNNVQSIIEAIGLYSKLFTDPTTSKTTIETAMVIIATMPLSASSRWINVPSGNVLFPAGRTVAEKFFISN